MTDTAAARTADQPESDDGGPLGASYRKLFSASTISNLGDGVGQIAYPWLASAVTRNGFLVALVAVAQRLPWLLFTLPAGVITDRNERRFVMWTANAVRAFVTLLVALVVILERDHLPGPDDLDDPTLVVDTNVVLFVAVLGATLLLGLAEVLYDNTAQTIMPSLVERRYLERANGRLWSIEQVMNTVVGPALGAALLALTFSAAFVFDAATFAVSAVLIAWLPRPAARPVVDQRKPWRTEAADGFRWLWSHELLRPLAITLGLLNMFGVMSGAGLVLFAQEVLGTSTIEFAILGTGGAIGGVLGGWTASTVSQRIGPGPALWLTLVGGGVTSIVIGLVSQWPIVWVMFAIFMYLGVIWNVITVSLRQTIIPDHLLGRVNSVYRFFAWGMMPIGAVLGGVLIEVGGAIVDRQFGLRLPWIVAGVGQILLLGFAATRLTSARIAAARAAAE